MQSDNNSATKDEVLNRRPRLIPCFGYCEPCYYCNHGCAHLCWLSPSGVHIQESKELSLGGFLRNPTWFQQLHGLLLWGLIKHAFWWETSKAILWVRITCVLLSPLYWDILLINKIQEGNKTNWKCIMKLVVPLSHFLICLVEYLVLGRYPCTQTHLPVCDSTGPSFTGQTCMGQLESLWRRTTLWAPRSYFVGKESMLNTCCTTELKFSPVWDFHWAGRQEGHKV